jgi:GGDEF domain-containing protein
MADELKPGPHLYAEDDLRHFLLREVQRSTRYQDFLSLCLIRLTSAEPSSRQVRDAIAREVADMLRSTDLVGSIGEDIAVVLVHTPDTDASMIAARIRERVDRPSAPPRAGAVAVHIGLACFPVDGTSDDVLLACAQARLEAAR